MLRAELARPSWTRESVAVGAATDPYQPAEGRYRLTRACIRELGAARTPFSLITRGPMIRRDVDVLVDAARRAKVHVSFSVPTLDERIWRATEPGTAPPRRRLEAVRVLVDAGIDTGVALAPLLPGLSDDPALLERVVHEARAAGASGIWANVLYLRPGTREHFLEALAREWPELLPEYERPVRGSRVPAGDRDGARPGGRARARAGDLAPATAPDRAGAGARAAGLRRLIRGRRPPALVECRPWRRTGKSRF